MSFLDLFSELSSWMCPKIHKKICSSPWQLEWEEGRKESEKKEKERERDSFLAKSMELWPSPCGHHCCQEALDCSIVHTAIRTLSGHKAVPGAQGYDPLWCPGSTWTLYLLAWVALSCSPGPPDPGMVLILSRLNVRIGECRIREDLMLCGCSVNLSIP